MNLGSLPAIPGARKKRKRLGRGEGSGHGGTSTRGHKGQKARSGGKVARGFEGGQMPIRRRLPKRGFVNFSRREFSVVNIGDLRELPPNTVVDEAFLRDQRFIRKRRAGIKILGEGEIQVPLTVRAHQFSESARKKIEGAGGKVEVVVSP